MFKERGGYEVESTLRGSDMVGWEYEGPFDDLEAQSIPGGFPISKEELEKKNVTGVSCHRVIDGGKDNMGSDVVVAGEGTGIVHIAPGCGDIDHKLGMKLDLVDIAPLDEQSCYLGAFGWLEGKSATDQETTTAILDDLKKKGLLIHVEEYPHVYPHCWRSGDELVFRIVDEWYIKMDWRDRIKKVVDDIRWIPDWGQEREHEWLDNMGDWMISKKRFWGLALPVWTFEDGSFHVVGSREELEELAVEGWDEFDGHSPHRPWIDRVKIRHPETGLVGTRIPDVGNPWLDAGIVPYSTIRYNSDREYWQQWFPADFVTECFPGQFRNWFYSLLALSTALEDRAPFKTLLGHALVRDENGKEMHKSSGNAIEFNRAAEEIGADVMRWMYSGQNPTANLNFGFGPAGDVRRKLLTLWNTYAFFVTYARVDSFDPAGDPVPVEERSSFDRWILAALQELVAIAHDSYSNYAVQTLVKKTERFVDQMSNWYLRRSRERFWKEGKDRDKTAAFHTLHEVLVTLSKVLAPVLPFVTDAIYRNLVVNVNEDAAPSIHLTEFPRVNERLVDRDLLARMQTVVQIVELGRIIRKEHKLRVRQPLSRISVALKSETEREWLGEFEDQILDELNIKELTAIEDPGELVTYKVKPNFRALGPRFGKRVPQIGKVLGSMNGAELAELCRAGKNVGLDLDGDSVELEPEDIDIQMDAAEGLAVAEEGGYLVALSTELTLDLLREGMVRDISRSLNEMRRKAAYNVADRIVVKWSSEDAEVQTAMAEFEDFIKREALAVEIQKVAKPSGDQMMRLDLESAAVIDLSVEKSDG